MAVILGPEDFWPPAGGPPFDSWLLVALLAVVLVIVMMVWG